VSGEVASSKDDGIKASPPPPPPGGGGGGGGAGGGARWECVGVVCPYYSLYY